MALKIIRSVPTLNNRYLFSRVPYFRTQVKVVAARFLAALHHGAVAAAPDAFDSACPWDGANRASTEQPGSPLGAERARFRIST